MTHRLPPEGCSGKNRLDNKVTIINDNQVNGMIILSLRASLVTQCKCHGVSGSCNIKTCWKGLPRFQVIGEHLRQKYNVATEVMSHGIKKQPKLLQVNSQQGLYQRDDLVYITKSPDYCLPNPKVGSIGTLGRRCNATSDDTDSCDSMCCGRGYRTYTVKKEEQCHCKFYLCCYVKCEQCWTQVDIHEYHRSGVPKLGTEDPRGFAAEEQRQWDEMSVEDVRSECCFAIMNQCGFSFQL
ncbi:protein Wnt-7b-like [Limulus polyphemus]|uniref:Protein Wnt n=1 Tax=Limulus polyphemus TaxID=6850 RepID=A0ABM1S5I3_LIMPO|nr:protein Wnt-7b-like [Limulus polyphemus]